MMNPVRIFKMSFVLAVFLFLTRCSFSPPSAPAWDVDLNIPLINETYTIHDLVKDIDGIKADSLNNLFVEFETAIDTFDAFNQLNLQGFAQGFSKKLGTFNVKSPGSRSLAIQLGDIYPPSQGLDGAQIPVPAFQFQVPSQDLPKFESLQWVEIQNGYIDLSIENNLSVPLGKPILIELRDTGQDTLIAKWEFADFIDPSQKASSRLDLSGKRLSGQLSLSVTGASPGSSQPVPVSETDGFVINVQVSDLKVSGAAAKVEPQQFSFDEKMKVGDSVVVAKAKIRKGKIDVTISGNLPLDARVSFTLPDFVDENGGPLQENLVLLENQVNNLVIDLAGFSFQPQEGDFGEQFVRVSAAISTSASDNIVDLMATDSVSANFAISEIYFSEISGKFYSKDIEVPRKSFSIDLPSDLDSIKLKDAELELMLFNTISFPANISLLITGYNDAGEQVELNIQETIQPGLQDGSPVLSKIKLTSQNSEITNFLNLLPTRVEVSGSVDIGQQDWIGTIRESDFITGKIKFAAPAAFQLPAQKFESAVSKVEMDADVRSKIETNLESGQFVARTKSHLPIGAIFYLRFATVDSIVFTRPELAIGPISVEAGQISPQSESVQAPRENEINITLSKEELLFFANEKFYTGVEIQFPGTNSQVVRLRASDYLGLKAYVGFKIRVQDDSK